MSDLASPNTPSEALFNPAWVEDRTYLDPMDGSLDFNFDLTLPSNVDLFGNTNERAQADVQNPSQSISEWSDPSPGACNSPQAEQALEAVARSTNETPGLTSAGPQGLVPELPVSPESTTSQPQTVPDSPQGYWSSLLGGNKSTEDTMATLGNAQSPAGLTADLSGDIDLGLENFAGGPDPYPWGPLQENYRGPNLASETAMASSFIDPVQLASTGVQRYAGHTALNPAVQTPATHLNLALPGRAAWATPQVHCGNPINPGMTAVPWTRQAKASTSSGPVYPIRARAATFAPPGTAESGAASLDLSLIDPDIMKELSGTHGPMVFGGTTAPQSVSASTPAGSRTMPHLTAPMAPPVIPARPIREGLPTRVQTERHSRSLEVQYPAQWTVPPPPACHPGAAAWDNIEPRKQMVLVHHRGGGTDVRPSDVYRPLKATPKAWGPPMFKDLFTYTEHGEWDPSRKFSKKDLSYYIINTREQAKRPLTIWIQHLPSQRNYRYPNAMSSKCRWDECPDPNHTILKGFYRVAFDEWSDVSGKVTDPFHNAGYMHLFCFEKMFDLFELIKYGYVRLEERNFPYENQNPMSVAEGHPKLTKTFQGWYYDQVTAYEKFKQEKARGGPEFRQIPKEQRLWSVLTDRYISLESDARMKMRATRNGNSIEKHRGDLELFVLTGNARRQRGRPRRRDGRGRKWRMMSRNSKSMMLGSSEPVLVRCRRR